MTHARTFRRAGALTVALAVAASAALAGLAAPASADPITRDSQIDVAPDYLVDTYGLPADHVFETVTFERFEWLLNGKYEDNSTPVTGRFAFLVGGAYDESITSTIGYIDQVAKQYGVDTIYTFDPALDGNTLNIWDTSELALDPAGKAPLEALGARLLTNLNADTTPAFTTASTDPYLFIYDKTHTVDVAGVPTEDRIVASLNVRKTAADFAVAGAVDEYKTQVASVFDAVAVGGVAQLDELDQWTFWKGEVNRRHTTQGGYSTATHGGKILDDSDAVEGWRIQTLTYPELKSLLQQDGDYVILFGGTWCHNTRAVINQVNQFAQQNDVDKVYIFDNSLDSTGNGGSNYLHIRDNPSIPAGGTLPRRASYLYGDLWNTYLTNVKTQYRTSASEAWTGGINPVQFYPGGDITQPVQLARKGQVPFLLHYNKDNVTGGSPAPVVSQWIRANAGTGGWTEYMIDWWHTVHASPTGPVNSNSGQIAFAAEAEVALQGFFEGLPVEPIAPEAPAAPVASVNGTSVTVEWAAPADGGSAITGYKVSLNGGTPVTVGASTLSHTFTGVAAGSHSATVVAVNAVGDSVASAASNTVTVADPAAEPVAPDAPSAPTASVIGSSVTVSWAAPADGGSAITGYKVSLDGGTPVSVGAGVTSHTFTGVAVGSHTGTVIATNAVGDSPASAASTAVTVVAAEEPEEPTDPEPVDPATVKGTVTVTGSLQQGGTITVKGTGFAESTPGFAVEIHSAPQLLGSVGTNASGAFTLTAKIPSTVPAGSHSIVVLYNGTVVSSAAISVAADPSLAATGVDSTSLASLGIVGLATLALGGLVAAGVGISRRRQAA